MPEAGGEPTPCQEGIPGERQRRAGTGPAGHTPAGWERACRRPHPQSPAVHSRATHLGAAHPRSSWVQQASPWSSWAAGRASEGRKLRARLGHAQVPCPPPAVCRLLGLQIAQTGGPNSPLPPLTQHPWMGGLGLVHRVLLPEPWPADDPPFSQMASTEPPASLGMPSSPCWPWAPIPLQLRVSAWLFQPLGPSVPSLHWGLDPGF